MLVGVVSDTHNNINNIKSIVELFNENNVETVVHTGDITNARSLEMFSELKCPLIGVFGNNDHSEEGLLDVCNKYKFDFRKPPLSLTLNERKIVIFHEPDLIKKYLEQENDVEIVLFGHTHRFVKEKIDDIILFNPGESAGMIQGKNSIGLIDLDTLEIRRIFF